LAALVPAREMVLIGNNLVSSPLHGTSIPISALHAAAYLNAGLFVVNMLPAVPLDGGKILYLLVEQRWNARTALMTVSSLGLFFACVSTLVLLGSSLSGAAIWSPPRFQVNLDAWMDARRGICCWDRRYS
jgi:Zn-dependent protease